jgi:Cu2+-containing amine oxidase
MVSARRLLFLGCGLFAISLFSAPSALAGPSCSGINRIDESFANGARWQLCWDVRSREAVVYREIYYTPPGGAERMVMAEVSLAQIHVPYDDNGARFHDITDYGAGGGNLNDLTNADCPDGALLQDGSKNVICKKVAARGAGYDATLEQVQGSQLELFSVSHVGAYNYIPRYHFMDDGTIEMVMGATGQLQRFEYDDPGSVDIGWPLDAAANRIGISHIHNYYFRMDFDLGDTRTDDVVEQIDVVADGTQSTRVMSVTPFTVEGSADVAPTALRRWRVRDGAINNANGHSVSYELIPLESGHRDEGPAYEPFTHNDFYVTKYSDCEQYASHNNQLLGCGDDLSEFVSGESLVGEDIVVWYGLTFHHIPRDEDEAKMHAHWNGFQLRPRDWSDATPLSVDAHECAPGALDFDTLALEAFADQDNGGTAFSTHEGTTLSMTGNTWKQTTGTYVVGPDTTVEFEFASAEEGEIHSIGFDEDDALNGDPRHFELYGN